MTSKGIPAILVCSRNPLLTKQLEASIKSTIGCTFDFLVFDNSKLSHGIAHVYNSLAAMSQTEYLIFVHEDMIFHSADWGPRLMSILENPSIGVVGLCGSTIRSKYPGSWVDIPLKYYRTQEHTQVDNEWFAGIQGVSQVVVVDGQFLAMRRDVWHMHPFDDLTFKGFHLYDMDICTKIYGELEVVVDLGIMSTHYSKGKYDKGWLDSSFEYAKKYKGKLPLQLEKLRKSELRGVNYLCFFSFIQKGIRAGWRPGILFICIIRLWMISPFNQKNLGISKQWLLMRRKK